MLEVSLHHITLNAHWRSHTYTLTRTYTCGADIFQASETIHLILLIQHINPFDNNFSCFHTAKILFSLYGNHLEMKNRSSLGEAKGGGGVVFLTMRKIFSLIPLSVTHWMHRSYSLLFLTHNSVSCWCQTFNIWPKNLRTKIASARGREKLSKMLAIRTSFPLRDFCWFIFL